MKPLVNLSSAPFRNRRLFWLAILALFVIPSYFGLKTIETKTRLESEITSSEMRVSNLEKRLGKVQKPAATNVTISADKNIELYTASQLIARRTFSWSQL